MTPQNIWTGLSFSTQKEDSAYDLLVQQSKYLIIATSGELRMEVDAVDSYLDQDPPIPVAVYTLYVVAPNLGNFRRKILTVTEGKAAGHFPVDIFCHIDEKKEEDVLEKDFINKLSAILSRPLVKTSIENLYQQSKEYSKSKV